MIFNKGELFCGPGGLALGATQASFVHNGANFGIRHAWANDIDEDACNTFRRNICPDRPESVYAMDIKELDEKIGFENLPPIEAFSFGFPCNDFSVVGEQKGMDGDFGGLYKYGVKVINAHNPIWFLAENVGGLQSANGGKAFKMIMSELASTGNAQYGGYNLTTHLYKFEEYGVPQCRHRILIIGIRKDFNLTFKVPKPTHLSNFKASRDAIENPPIHTTEAFNHEFTHHSSKVKEMLNYIPAGKNAWCEEIPERLRLNVKGAKMSQIYRRLNPELPAYTITGSGGGGTHVYHWEENRALTNRERARLQTFPDNFIFEGKKEKVRKQIGMAVPPEGAQIIFDAILKTFAGIPYETVEPKWAIEENEFIKA